MRVNLVEGVEKRHRALLHHPRYLPHPLGRLPDNNLALSNRSVICQPNLGDGSAEKRTSHGPGSPSAVPTSAALGIESSFERPRVRHQPDPSTIRALDTPDKALSQHRRHAAVSEERSSKGGAPPTGPNAPAEAGRSTASSVLRSISPYRGRLAT